MFFIRMADFWQKKCRTLGFSHVNMVITKYIKESVFPIGRALFSFHFFKCVKAADDPTGREACQKENLICFSVYAPSADFVCLN